MTTWAADLVNGSDTQVAPAQVAAVAPTVYSKANPCQITSNGHGLLTGDYIYIVGVTGTGWTVVNGYWTVTYVDANNFTIPVSTSGATGATPTALGTWIPAIQKSNPCQVTLKAHGFSAGQKIYITSVAGMTNLNFNVYKVGTVTNANNFTLTDINDVNINATGYGAYTSGGTFTTYSKIITGITKANPAVVTCTSHGYSNGDKVYFDVQGMTQLHKFIGTVANKTTDTFELSGVNSSAYSTFTSGTCRKPYLNLNTINAIPTTIFNDNDEIYVAQTWKDDSSIDVGSGNITFTQGSTSVSTSVSLVGTVAVGDFIGLTTAKGGWDNYPSRPDVFYRVSAISSSAITLITKYAATTTTVSSISRLRLATEIRDTGSASAIAVTMTKNNITIEGGYDFSGGTITRNGETWIAPVTKNNSYATMLLNGTGQTIRYFGFYGAFTSACVQIGTNGLMEYCFIHNTAREGAQTTGGIMRYCTSVSLNAGYVLFLNNANGLTTRCYANASTTTAGYSGFANYSNSGIISECLAEYCGVGFSCGSAAVYGKVVDCIATNCTYGIEGFAYMYVDGCTCNNCTYGISNATDTRGNVFKNCTLNNCTYGVYISRGIAAVLENMTYNSCGRDVYADTITGKIFICGHTSTTPTTWAIDISVASDVKISNFAIDAPSLSKAISSTSSAIGWALPIYTIQGTTQIPEGAYYVYGSYVKETLNYRTSSPSMKLQLNATWTTNFGDTKIYSFFAKAGVSKTITFYMKSHPSWAGTIVPKWKLNGQTIETETSITSVDSANWQQFTYTCDASNIDFDGELSLEFNVNATSNPIYLDDFTVT